MTSKVALVTGAARKLGAEICRSLASEGYFVIVHANKSRSEAEHTALEIEKQGGLVDTFIGDLTDNQTLRDINKFVLCKNGYLDVLVNNASLFEYDFPGKGNKELLLKSLMIHALVPFELIEVFAELASPDRKLAVFNILDQKLLAMNPDYMSYTIGKAALRAITEVWQSANSDSVRVFGIMPGNTYPSGPQSEDDFQRSGHTNLLGRHPKPRDICDAITFFIKNPKLPAQNLAVDAGEHIIERGRDPAFE